MSLKNTFGKAEKPAEEKKLEVITSKEGIIKDLESYFEQNKYKGNYGIDDLTEYLSACRDFLKSFKLNPKIISEFNKKVRSVEEKESFGLYLSTMIQTSHNQGCNNFVFDNVNADCFGAFLKGQPENPIKMITETINGSFILYTAMDCLAEIQNYQGEDFGFIMRNCTIKSENKETLETIKAQVDGGRNNKFELKKWV